MRRGVDFNLPLLFGMILNRHIVPVPATLERAVHWKQRLITRVHRCANVEVVREKKHPSSQNLIHEIHARLNFGIESVDLRLPGWINHRGLLRKLLANMLTKIRIGNHTILRKPLRVTIKQLEQIAKHLRTVSAIDFLDDEVDLLRRHPCTRRLLVLPRSSIRLREHLIDKLVADAKLLLTLFDNTKRPAALLAGHFRVGNAVIFHRRLVRPDKSCIVRIRMEGRTEHRFALRLVLRLERLTRSRCPVCNKLTHFRHNGRPVNAILSNIRYHRIIWNLYLK